MHFKILGFLEESQWWQDSDLIHVLMFPSGTLHKYLTDSRWYINICWILIKLNTIYHVNIWYWIDGEGIKKTWKICTTPWVNLQLLLE